MLETFLFTSTICIINCEGENSRYHFCACCKHTDCYKISGICLWPSTLYNLIGTELDICISTHFPDSNPMFNVHVCNHGNKWSMIGMPWNYLVPLISSLRKLQGQSSNQEMSGATYLGFFQHNSNMLEYLFCCICPYSTCHAMHNTCNLKFPLTLEYDWISLMRRPPGPPILRNGKICIPFNLVAELLKSEQRIIHVNPLHARFFRGNQKIYLQFMSFLHIDITQVVEIFHRVRQEFPYST